MSVISVIGLQWGDEGKGKIVDWLAANAAHVARFQGGHNAGHTLLFNGKKTALHLLPCGVLHKTVRCYIGGGVVVSPSALLEELQWLEKSGISLPGRLFISSSAALVLPYHVALDRQREAQNGGIGTTLRGIGPAHEDKIARRAMRLYDLYNGAGADKLAANIRLYNRLLDTPLSADNLWHDLQKTAEQLRPCVCDNLGGMLAAAADNGEHILLEGAQGVMLDIEQGTYPYTTSAQCLPAAAAGGLGVELSPTVLGVSKAYATRVGKGPFPTELSDETGQRILRVGEEVGATTGRNRRCGWLDIPMLRHALRVSGCRRLALVKLDVLDMLEQIKLCVSYQLDDAVISLPPADPLALARCQPVYETFEGWRKTAEMREESHLPEQAHVYLRRIEELTSATIDIISTGADRQSAIVRRHPFSGQ